MGKVVCWAGVVLGVLLLLAGVGARVIVAPATAVLPRATDTTREYAGTAAALLNPEALTASGAATNVLLNDVPITVLHTTTVLGAKGHNALVADTRDLQVNGTSVTKLTYRYAVDRTDLGPGSGYAGVVRQRGLTFNWPIRTVKQDYTGWVSDIGRTAKLHYTGQAHRGGINTYVFTTAVGPLPITDPQVLTLLPKALPKSAVAKLAAGLNLSAAQLATFQAVLPSLPDPVPFSYTYQVTATYWVAPASGIVVDVDQHEVRTLNISLGGASVPVTPVSDITFTSTPSTLKDAVKDGRDKGQAIHLVYLTLPLGLLLAGAVLLVIGLIGVVLGRRRKAAAPG